MAICVIELNDYQLTLLELDQQGQTISNQQLGYALVENDDVCFGYQAYKQSKTAPAKSFCYYWQRLGYEQIQTNNQSVRHFADLAYLQLKDLVSQAQSCSQIVFIAPSHFSSQQLSLLLGIAQSCQLEVIALVNSAVLALEQPRGQRYSFYDIGLHYYEQSEIQVDTDISLAETSQRSEKGVYDLYRFLANWLNQLFISQCRFDASHLASHEQALYLQIATMLLKEDNKYLLTISDKTLEVELSALNEQISEFFADVIERITKSPTPVIMTERFANLLSGLPVASTLMPYQSVKNYQRVIALKSHLAEHYLNDEAHSMELLTSLPCPKETITQCSLEQATPVSNQCNTLLSHLLCNGVAVPLNNQTLYLNADLQSPVTLEKQANSMAYLSLIEGSYTLYCNNNSNILINEQAALSTHILCLGDVISSALSELKFTAIYVKEEF